ncbi:MAG: hypothetical protein AAGL49_01285 [Pseudomonadota bacterium]
MSYLTFQILFFGGFACALLGTFALLRLAFEAMEISPRWAFWQLVPFANVISLILVSRRIEAAPEGGERSPVLGSRT